MNGVLVLGSPGLHLLIATVQWQANSSGGRTVTLTVKRGGVVVGEAVNISAPTPFGSSVMQAVLLHIAEPGDEVTVSVKQTSGADLDVLAIRTYLQIARVAQ